jgi:hypothetical protein
MTPYIVLLDEPCQVIENWRAAEVRNEENSRTVPACWIRVGDKVEFKYWINGTVFQVEWPAGARK